MDQPHTDPTVHLYLLLDRSGSMEAIRDDVIGGFNSYLRDQQSLGERALMTLVQFDSVDPQEVVADACPLAEITPLDHGRFVPRGSTPLLDATGALLDRARARARARAEAHQPSEDIVVVTITDGHENHSRQWSRAALVAQVQALELAGWEFLFLSAGLDAYADAAGMGYDRARVARWEATPDGADVAFSALSRATTSHRLAEPARRRGRLGARVRQALEENDDAGSP